MAKTRTGQFPIGFRRGWSDWQKDLGALARYAKENNFECIDTGALAPEELRQITGAGVRIGSVDLKAWTDLVSPDAGKRKDAAQANGEYIKSCLILGVKAFFTVLIPGDPARPRLENFKFAVDGYGELNEAIGRSGAKIVIEGWPGGPPNYANLACTPADYRAIFKEIGGDSVGINFDPSHLIRMSIDPVRFLGEFAGKVFHVHAKDTEILDDDLYELGNLQPATFAKGHGFGGHHWRYTIPGHGVARWGKIFSILKERGYNGYVCIELEDENFNSSTDGEQRGLIASRDFLQNV